MQKSRIEWTVPSSGSFTEVDKILVEAGWTVDDFEKFLVQMEVEFPIRIGIFNYIEKSFFGISGCKMWKFRLAREDETSVIYVTHAEKTTKFRINKREHSEIPSTTTLVG